jgi:hypothetical protein
MQVRWIKTIKRAWRMSGWAQQENACTALLNSQRRRSTLMG